MARQYINEGFKKFIHGADYNPEQWLETKEIWDEDMRLMKLANCNEMTVGIFSWAKLEPKEGQFDFSFLDEIIDKVAANGGKIVLATPSGARPHWLADKYPEVLRVNEQGQRMCFCARHNHCYTSPIYREKVKIINGQLAKRYGKNPAVVAWHISNEYGGKCYCPLCQAAFRNFLKEKYVDIKELNKAYWSDFWSHTYDNFEQVDIPMATTERGIHGLNLDWRRFVSHQTLDFMKWEIAALREWEKEIPVTTNMMPAFYDLNYNEFADYIDVASWDSYPDWHSDWGRDVPMDTGFWHDCFRSLKNRPFMLMESAPGLVNWKEYNKLKRPGMDTLASMQAVAHGSDSVQYFQWRKSRGGSEKFHGAVVGHRGTEETRVFKAVQATGAYLEKIAEVAGSGVEARVAIIFDWENMWALDDCAGFQKSNKKYAHTCVQYYRPFWNEGISVDVIGVEKDFSKYDLVIAPMLYMTSEKTVKKIADYVKNGGNFYATYMLGMVNETDLCYLGGFPAKELKEVFGIWNEEIDTLYPKDSGEVEMDGKKYVVKDYAELLHLQGAKVLASYSQDFYAGMPACTVNTYGKGKAYYQAFRDNNAFIEEIMTALMRELNLKGSIQVEGRKGEVTSHKRTDGEITYLFVENYSETAVEGVKLDCVYEDMQTGEKVEKVSLSPYSMKVLKK